MKLIFATNNQHKVDEIRSVLKGPLELITLKEAGLDIEIPEPFDTLEENARTKSTTIFELTGTDCFSEDTGLEVEALGGEPGLKVRGMPGKDVPLMQILTNSWIKCRGSVTGEPVSGPLFPC